MPIRAATISTIVFLLVVLSVSTASALTATPIVTRPPVATIKARKCDAINEVIKQRITQYENSKSTRVNAYGKAVQHIERLVQLGESIEADTREVKVDLDTLNTKIEVFTTSYDEFIQILRDAMIERCNDEGSKFDATINEGRNKLATIRTQSQEIRQLIVGTIRSDMLTLKDTIIELQKLHVSPTPR